VHQYRGAQSTLSLQFPFPHRPFGFFKDAPCKLSSCISANLPMSSSSSTKRDGDQLYADNLQHLTEEVNAGLNKFRNEAAKLEPQGFDKHPHAQLSYVFFGAPSLACSVVETLLKDDDTKYELTGKVHGLTYIGSRYRRSGELRVVVDLEEWTDFVPADLRRAYDFTLSKREHLKDIERGKRAKLQLNLTVAAKSPQDELYERLVVCSQKSLNAKYKTGWRDVALLIEKITGVLDTSEIDIRGLMDIDSLEKENVSLKQEVETVKRQKASARGWATRRHKEMERHEKDMMKQMRTALRKSRAEVIELMQEEEAATSKGAGLSSSSTVRYNKISF
jgi:hypothetical protein